MSSIVFADSHQKIKYQLNTEETKKLDKRLQNADISETKEIIIKVKDKSKLKKQKDFQDTLHPKLLKATVKWNKIKELLNDKDVEYIEEDAYTTILGDFIPYGVSYTNSPNVMTQTKGIGVKALIIKFLGNEDITKTIFINNLISTNETCEG